jgi:hypothetical protein
MLEYPLTKANRLRLAQAFRLARRVDLSVVLGSSLLAWCLERHLEPHWDAPTRNLIIWPVNLDISL